MVDSKSKKIEQKTINVKLNLIIGIRLFDRVDLISRSQENIKKVSK
jgi:hypothetical protein